MRHSSDTCLLRTGKLWDADMVCSMLEEHGVPHYRRSETSGGLELAMPAAAAPGPGIWYTVWVPNERLDEARRVLEDVPLDFDREPDVLDHAPTPKGRRIIFFYAALLLAFIILGLGQNCAGLIRQIVNH